MVLTRYSLFNCDVSGLHDLCPLLGLVRDQLAEFGRCHRLRQAANLGEKAKETATAQREADTAGRLPTQLHLMDEIRKVKRVIAKAEWTQGEANPRFVVTSLPADRYQARALYEKFERLKARLAAAVIGDP